MDVTIPDKYAKFVMDKVAEGQFSSPGELVTHALGLLEEQDAFERFKLGRLKADIQVGIDQISRGEIVDGDDFEQEIRARFGSVQ